MSLVKIEETNKAPAWIAGVKFSYELKFHHQLVTSLKLKQKLWQTWQDSKQPCDFYFMEIELPVEIAEPFIDIPF